MMSRKKRWKVLPVCLVLLLWLLTGCSKLSPLDNGETNSSVSSSSDYPPITEELLQNGPAPGHPILRLEQPPSAMGVENWDYAEAWIAAKKGGQVFTSQGSGCIIPAKALSRNELITVTLPQRGYAIVDFGPHPLRFNKYIWIAISLNGTDLDENDWHHIQNIQIYYWNDETNTYELYPSYYDPHRNALMCLTNHFSRYIIA
jgi:hypothetical protein